MTTASYSHFLEVESILSFKKPKNLFSKKTFSEKALKYCLKALKTLEEQKLNVKSESCYVII